MTLNKAIEILESIIHYVEPGDPPDEHQACQLGIEALKAVKDCRASHMFCPGLTLPGETKEKKWLRNYINARSVMS